jgi:hypothetical protein
VSHDCIKRINEQLKEHNTQISVALSLTDPGRELIHVGTSKADLSSRKKPMSMFASYCPFCGIRLQAKAPNA